MKEKVLSIGCQRDVEDSLAVALLSAFLCGFAITVLWILLYFTFLTS